MRAPSTSGLAIELLLRVIDVNYGYFTLFLKKLLVDRGLQADELVDSYVILQRKYSFWDWRNGNGNSHLGLGMGGE